MTVVQSVNILKTIELYNLNEWTVCELYLNKAIIIIKILKISTKKKKLMQLESDQRKAIKTNNKKKPGVGRDCIEDHFKTAILEEDLSYSVPNLKQSSQ